MVTNEFLGKLNHLLKEIPKRDRQDILSDFEEHFTIGFNEGKTEEEIIRELGDPKTIAAEALVDYQSTRTLNPQPAVNITRCILAGIGMFFFNLIVVLGPVAAIFSIYVSFCAVSFSFIISPLLSLVVLMESNFVAFLFVFFSSFILCGLGLLLGIAMIYTGKILWQFLVGYIRFNISVIMGRK
ncbi:HAAS signaling domain-containing protein [Sporolactobacillus pectinivorans]|uniref:HAAS signaling domain-containing protein n=1 Tax=Sporolactobacillus pectinivorans TaxID=1591408 RepID=UPI000C2695B2|nr:DUF1700 domain-containing protein [Sporolactobacillus pectinivorans]